MKEKDPMDSRKHGRQTFSRSTSDNLRVLCARPSKRQCRHEPPSWLDATHWTTLPTLGVSFSVDVCSQFTTKLFLERLHKEIVQNLNFSLTPRRLVDKASTTDSCQLHQTHLKTSRVVKRQVKIGINQTLRALEKALRQDAANAAPPRLLVVCTDLQPPTILAYIRQLLSQLDDKTGKRVPTLWLGSLESDREDNNAKGHMGNCRGISQHLGKILGTSRVGTLAFFQDTKGNGGGNPATADATNDVTVDTGSIRDRINSFVDFWRGKV